MNLRPISSAVTVQIPRAPRTLRDAAMALAIRAHSPAWPHSPLVDASDARHVDVDSTVRAIGPADAAPPTLRCVYAA